MEIVAWGMLALHRSNITVWSVSRLKSLQSTQRICPSSKLLVWLYLCHQTIHLLCPFVFFAKISQLELQVKVKVHGREIGCTRKLSNLGLCTLSWTATGSCAEDIQCALHIEVNSNQACYATSSLQSMAVLHIILHVHTNKAIVCACTGPAILFFKVENKRSSSKSVCTSIFYEKSHVCSCHSQQSGATFHFMHALLGRI